MPQVMQHLDLATARKILRGDAAAFRQLFDESFDEEGSALQTYLYLTTMARLVELPSQHWDRSLSATHDIDTHPHLD